MGSTRSILFVIRTCPPAFAQSYCSPSCCLACALYSPSGRFQKKTDRFAPLDPIDVISNRYRSDQSELTPDHITDELAELIGRLEVDRTGELEQFQTNIEQKLESNSYLAACLDAPWTMPATRPDGTPAGPTTRELAEQDLFVWREAIEEYRRVTLDSEATQRAFIAASACQAVEPPPRRLSSLRLGGEGSHGNGRRVDTDHRRAIELIDAAHCLIVAKSLESIGIHPFRHGKNKVRQ